MNSLEVEIKSICQLLNTWQHENIEIAFQIMAGNPKLKKAIRELYLPLFKFCNFAWNSKNFLKLPHHLAYKGHGKKEIEQSDALKELLALMPITTVSYSYQELTEIPWWFCYLTQLQEIKLNHNLIEKIPDELRNLKNLKLLRLNVNKIKEVPVWIGELKEITKLQLDFNEIEKIPESIGQLTNLYSLCLEGNKIKSLPKSTKNLTALSWLSIENTPLGDKHNLSDGLYLNVEDIRLSSFWEEE